MKGLKPNIIRYLGLIENNSVKDLKYNKCKYEKIEFMVTGETNQLTIDNTYYIG
jgi:hypothetical protein